MGNFHDFTTNLGPTVARWVWGLLTGAAVTVAIVVLWALLWRACA